MVTLLVVFTPLLSFFVLSLYGRKLGAFYASVVSMTCMSVSLSSSLLLTYVQSSGSTLTVTFVT